MQSIIEYELLQTEKDYAFRSFQFAKNHGLSLKDYKSVYKSVINVESESDIPAIAELLFMIFNSDKRPKDYRGRSMSVSDIVIINHNYYYCNYLGFKKLDVDIQYKK